MVIRHFEPSDEKSVLNLVKEGMASYGVAIDEKRLRNQLLVPIESKALHLVVVNDQGVVGAAGVVEIRPGMVEITPFFLSNDLRGSGKGKFLLDMLINFCRTHGYRKMVMFLNPLMVEAIDFFKRNNFQEEGLLNQFAALIPHDRPIPLTHIL